MDRLKAEADKNFPEKVTAFRKEMAVHGRFGLPCPRCGAPIQRIRYADNETNYCATCQTGGKLLADRSLSRLLGKDWPRTLDELEALKRKVISWPRSKHDANVAEELLFFDSSACESFCMMGRFQPLKLTSCEGNIERR